MNPQLETAYHVVSKLIRYFNAFLRQQIPTILLSCALPLTPSTQPLSTLNGYKSLIGSTALFISLVYFAASWLTLNELPFIWILSESSFLILNIYRIWKLNNIRTPPETDLGEVQSTFDNFLHTLRWLNPLHHLKDWVFLFVPIACEECAQFVDEDIFSLPIKNIAELMSYAFAFQPFDPFSEMGSFCERLINRFSETTKITFKQGYKPNVRFKAHLWDDIKACHYPLALYLVSEALGAMFAWLMALSGFSRFDYQGMKFFYRGHPNPLSTPIILLHGLGIGPIMYLPFIWLLSQCGHPVLVPEFRHISLRISFSSPTVDDVVTKLKGFLDLHGVDGCIVVGHSYGTFVATRLYYSFPERVKGLCLIDPVCCVMHNPQLVNSFVCGGLPWGSMKESVASLVQVFLRHDPSIATSICRQLKWSKVNLWPSQTPDKTLLVFSEGDVLIPVQDIKRIFTKTGAKLLVHPFHNHGEFLIDRQWQYSIVDKITKVLLTN